MGGGMLFLWLFIIIFIYLLYSSRADWEKNLDFFLIV